MFDRGQQQQTQATDAGDQVAQDIAAPTNSGVAFTSLGPIPPVGSAAGHAHTPTASELAFGETTRPATVGAGVPATGHIRSEQDLTHHVDGPLGTMAVVPDGYVGPMPAGAVRQSDYQRMTSVYSHIASGHSSLEFDTRNFFKDGEGKELSLLRDPETYMKAMAAANAFRQQYMGYVQDLVKTPAGLQMLEQLDASKLKTTLQHAQPGNGNVTAANVPEQSIMRDDGSPGKGTGSNIFLDPTAQEWDGETCTQGHQPWMADRPRFGFYHELVHAYHNVRGDAAVSGEPPWPWLGAMRGSQRTGVADRRDRVADCRTRAVRRPERERERDQGTDGCSVASDVFWWHVG